LEEGKKKPLEKKFFIRKKPTNQKIGKRLDSPINPFFLFLFLFCLYHSSIIPSFVLVIQFHVDVCLLFVVKKFCVCWFEIPFFEVKMNKKNGS